MAKLCLKLKADLTFILLTVYPFEMCVVHVRTFKLPYFFLPRFSTIEIFNSTEAKACVK